MGFEVGWREMLAVDLMLVSADLLTLKFPVIKSGMAAVLPVIKSGMAAVLLSCKHSGMHTSMAEA